MTRKIIKGFVTQCAYCDKEISGSEITRDHLLPRSLGGGNGDNLYISCSPCNVLKRNYVFWSLKSAREFIRQRKHDPKRMGYNAWLRLKIRCVIRTRRELLCQLLDE